MISIRHPKIYEFAERHCNAVVDYFENHRQKRFRDFIEKADLWIRKNITDFNFRKVIMASPEELELIVGLYDSSDKWGKSDKFGFFRLKNLYKNKFSLKDSGLGYDARQLIDDLEISVCPYCNRNFIYNTYKKRSSEIDHFYAKDKYPILAMSFFNLIPSCRVCNPFKSNSNLPLINPYDIRYDWNELVNFKLKVTAADFYFNANSIELILKNIAEKENVNVKTGVNNSIKVFELEDQYDHHRDFVVELIQKKYIYSEDYLNALYKQYEGTLFRNREDLLRLVTTNFIDEKDLKNRPLAKLTKDIVEQLDL